MRQRKAAALFPLEEHISKFCYKINELYNESFTRIVSYLSVNKVTVLPTYYFSTTQKKAHEMYYFLSLLQLQTDQPLTDLSRLARGLQTLLIVMCTACSYNKTNYWEHFNLNKHHHNRHSQWVFCAETISKLSQRNLIIDYSLNLFMKGKIPNIRCKVKIFYHCKLNRAAISQLIENEWANIFITE